MGARRIQTRANDRARASSLRRRTRSRRERAFRLAAGFGAAAVTSFGGLYSRAHIASAYNLSGCSWAEVPIDYADSAMARYTNLTVQAIEDWDTAIGRSGLLAERGSRPDFAVAALDLGNVPVDAVFHQPGASPSHPGCDTDGNFVPGNAMVTINRFYADTYPDDRVRSLIAHEFGHALGLDHNNDTFDCGGYTKAESVMHQASSIRAGAGDCSVITPQIDDAEGVISLYSAGK